MKNPSTRSRAEGNTAALESLRCAANYSRRFSIQSMASAGGKPSRWVRRSPSPSVAGAGPQAGIVRRCGVLAAETGATTLTLAALLPPTSAS